MKHRIHSYQQLEHSDCGITCIRIIARYYGKKIDPAYLRSLCDANRLGISIRDLTDALNEIGFDSYTVKVSPERLDDMPLPSILYWNQSHFIVLYKVRKDTFFVADPSRGKMKLSRKNFLQMWKGDTETGICILLEPRPEFLDTQFPKPKTKHSLLGLLKDAVKINRKSFAISIFFSLLVLIADIVIPFLFQTTIDKGIQDRDISLVWILVGAQLMIFIGNYLSNTIVEIVMSKLGLRLSINMMSEYLVKLINLPVSFFERKSSADLIKKTDDQYRIKNFLISFPETMFLTVLSLLVFSSLMIWFSFPIFLIVVSFTCAGIIWNSLFLRKRREIDYSYFSASAENQNNLYELINGMPEIRANGAENIRVEIWRKVQQKINDLSLQNLKLKIYMGAGTSLFSQLRDIVVLGVSATMVINGEMTIGIMMTISYIEGRLTMPFSNISNAFSVVQDTTMSIERVQEVMENNNNIPNAIEVSPVDSSIRLNDVWFRYAGSSSPYILRNLSLDIKPESTTAIVGESGEGKSTLIKILLGMYVPCKGDAVFGKVSYDSLNTKDWLRLCSVVMQEGMIYSGSILSNIALTDEKPDKEKAAEALRIACLDDFVNSLPMGLNTKIGNTGIGLSGGQKQRLLIARAVYKNPEIILMDEATSSLDAATESSIVSNLMQFCRTKTVIIAAHRLSTIMHADTILFLKDGQTVESGTHTELIQKRGCYYNLFKQQISNGIT